MDMEVTKMTYSLLLLFLPKYSTIISLRAPYELSSGSYAWYEIYPKSDGTLNLILKLPGKH